MCQYVLRRLKFLGAFPPTGRDRRDETTSARPHQHPIDVPPARHRRDTLSQVRHVVHAQGLCL